jgi:dihydrofolate synthase/folylpolyglutamate synthase
MHSLDSLPRFATKPGLERIRKILELLGNPQQDLKCVHITGTNGKGSTSAMLESIVRNAGYKTGLFTSPHLFAYNERIKINGKNISDEDFNRCLNKVQAAVESMTQSSPGNRAMQPALFEVLTAAALLHFQQQKVDLAIIEVGIGGLLDPTNVVSSLIAIITNVGLEHTDILGNSKEKIAHQKAGIIKHGSYVITAERDQKVLTIIRQKTIEEKAQLRVLHPSEMQSRNLQIPLLGDYQLQNAGLAILAAERLKNHGFQIDEEAIHSGLAEVSWPLRLEIIHRNPTILVDGAHNLHGIQAARDSIKKLFPREKSEAKKNTQRRILVLGVAQDKDYAAITKLLSQDADIVILTKSQYRGTEPRELAKHVDPKINPQEQVILTTSPEEAARKVQQIAHPEDLVTVLGSLYMAAQFTTSWRKFFPESHRSPEEKASGQAPQA